MDKGLFACHKEYRVTNDTLGISQRERGLFTSQWEQCANAKKKKERKKKTKPSKQSNFRERAYKQDSVPIYGKLE